eukprot:ctg_736.g351
MAAVVDLDVVRSYLEVVEAAAPASFRSTTALPGPDGAGEAADDNQEPLHVEKAFAEQGVSLQEMLAQAPDAALPGALARIAVEEHRVKEHLKKLKFNYLELQTKLHFLESVIAVSPGSEPSAVGPSEEPRPETAERLQRLEAVSAEVASSYAEYVAEYEQCRAMVLDLHARLQKRRAQETLQTHTAATEALRAEHQQLAGEIASLEWEQRPLQGNIRDLEDDIERLRKQSQADVTRHDNDTDTSAARMAAWYTSMLALLEAACGIAVEHIAADALVLRVRNTANTTTYRFTLQLESSHLHVRQVVVDPPPAESAAWSTTALSPLLQQANALRDLGWLVRQLQHRLP